MIERKKFDLSAFTRVQDELIAKNTQAWKDGFFSERIHKLKNYTPEEIEEIINSSTLARQQKLSRDYFDKDGFYRRIILYYATLLNYSSLLIPIPSFGKQLSDSNVEKKYYASLGYLQELHLPEVFTRMSLYALIYGSYFGLIQSLNKKECVIFDLPPEYCRSRFKDIKGNDIVEFDVSYFNSIIEEDVREDVLKIYPRIISTHWKKYLNGRVSSPWVILPADVGICFTFFDDGRPLFLNVIPATIQYDDTVDTERERELEEIRKIIVQKVPHLNDGQLLFEPDEALEMHKGAVGMMKGNKNLSVLTTYADVDAIISKTTSDNVSNSLEKMLQNVYANAGVTGELFAPTGTQAIPYAIKNDITLMMMLGNKYSRFISYILNTLFGNSNVGFKYLILPITEYTKSDFITDSFKLAQSGYSFLVPAIALGMNQLEFTSIKDLENNILKMEKVLVPLKSAYTSSNKDGEGTGKVGAPEKPLEQKAKKTIQNEDAINRQGGSE